MLTAAQIEEMRAKIVRAAPSLELVQQNDRVLPTDAITYSRVIMATREQWNEILDLAAMAARIRER